MLASPGHLQFIVECHGNTLLPQFLGMYRLTVDGVETYMVVTRNVFSHRLTVHRKYDLKVGYAGYATHAHESHHSALHYRPHLQSHIHSYNYEIQFHDLAFFFFF